MLPFYTLLTGYGAGRLNALLQRRLVRGKEDPARLGERRGEASRPRPEGRLIWLHAASVGEAQSALILIGAILQRYPDFSILVTTGTVTSAQLMAKKLPDRAVHHFMPLDHPDWVARFLDHWRPDFVLWMESEFWPNALLALQKRSIPAALVNARLSDRSYKKWRWLRADFARLLSTFDIVFAQTDTDALRFQHFGAKAVIVSDNLKYSAAPLGFDEAVLQDLKTAVQGRPVIVYASTHAGEEAMIGRIHTRLQDKFPNVLSIIIPRHPDRGAAIAAQLTAASLSCALRTQRPLPDSETHIYIADTLGELGLFYRLSTIVYIGRSLSDDGGGGHNPLEAAQLDCAILHGPHVQNLQEIYDALAAEDACLQADSEEGLGYHLDRLLTEPERVQNYAARALAFSNAKSGVVDRVMAGLEPYLQKAGS
ncbi:MAG: 3-deoxy-D-manno-octulosonic acid transferase [Bdellovibrionales bacterium]